MRVTVDFYYKNDDSYCDNDTLFTVECPHFFKHQNYSEYGINGFILLPSTSLPCKHLIAVLALLSSVISIEYLDVGE